MGQTRSVGLIFSDPFRITPSGAVATIDDSSDPGIAQLIAAIVKTHAGERLMFPDFGLPDPVFSKIEPTLLAAVIGAYGPNVRLTKLESSFPSGTQQDVLIGFDNNTGGSSGS